MIYIIIVMSVILFAMICIFVGYKIAEMRWDPKNLISRLEQNLLIMQNLSNTNKTLEDNIKINYNWYVGQITTIANYVKTKYNDSIIQDQFGKMEGFSFTTKDKKVYNLDELLDKASKYGLKSLDEDEKRYLREQGKNI